MISSANNSTTIIKQPPIASAFKYLGVDKPPSGNQTKKIKSLTTYAQRGARIFRRSNLNHYQIKNYLKTYLLPKLMTTLACSHLSANQYYSVQKQYTISAISSIGYNRTWPKDLRYGCHQYCRLQLKHLKIEALVKKMLTYVCFYSNLIFLN